MSTPIRDLATHGRLAKIATAVQAAVPAPAPETSLSVIAQKVLAAVPVVPQAAVRTDTIKTTKSSGSPTDAQIETAVLKAVQAAAVDGSAWIGDVVRQPGLEDIDIERTHEAMRRLRAASKLVAEPSHVPWSTLAADRNVSIDTIQRVADTYGLVDPSGSGPIRVWLAIPARGGAKAAASSARSKAATKASAALTNLPAPPATRADGIEDLGGASAAPRLTLEDRIRAAYLRVTNGKWNEFVTLVDLRPHLSGERRSDVDAMLLQMQQRGDLSLHTIDDPQRRGPKEDDAALRVAGVRRDIVNIGGENAPPPMEDRIRAAYLRASGGKLNGYVKLAELRRRLPGAERADVDAALVQMEKKGGTFLYPIDDPQARGPEDDAAALRGASVRRDLVCIEPDRDTLSEGPVASRQAPRGEDSGMPRDVASFGAAVNGALARLDRENRLGGLVPLPMLRAALRHLGLSRGRFDQALLDLEAAYQVDLKLANDPQDVVHPELGIKDPRRGLVYYVMPRSDPAPKAEDIASFAHRVVEAATRSKTGRFGDRKVFISHVYREAGRGMGVDAFKARLVEAQHKGLLNMSRADLVEAMDPRDIQLSETRNLGETMHFIRLDDKDAHW